MVSLLRLISPISLAISLGGDRQNEKDRLVPMGVKKDFQNNEFWGTPWSLTISQTNKITRDITEGILGKETKLDILLKQSMLTQIEVCRFKGGKSTMKFIARCVQVC